MHSLGHSIPLFLAFVWLLWPPFSVPFSSTSFRMQFLSFVEWCLSQKWVRGINSDIEKAHFHPSPCACDPCTYGHPKPWQNLHQNPYFRKSKPQAEKLYVGTSLPCSPHYGLSLWVYCLCFLEWEVLPQGSVSMCHSIETMCLHGFLTRSSPIMEALRFNSSLTNAQELLLLSNHLLKT